MDIMSPFNTLFVMDDPTTPLYSNIKIYIQTVLLNLIIFFHLPLVPVCNSFDQEFQLQENIQLNMLPQNTTLKSSGTAEASPTNALPYQSSEEQIELPLDLFDYFENVPLNIQEMIEEEDYGKVLCDTEYYQTSRRNPNSDFLSNELLPTPITDLVQAQGILELKNEDAVMNFEEMCSFSLVTNTQAEENIKREPLYLNLSSTLQPTNSSSEQDVTTPVLIDMLLESEEISKKVANLHNKIPIINLDYINLLFYSLMQQQVDVKPTLVCSNLPQVLQDISGDSATEYSLPPTPISRSRVNTKRSSNPSKNSDLRRVRNNEASRKSRQNRRKKLQTQSQLVDVLEEEGRRLANKIKELETLKVQIMKYMTGSIKTTTPSGNVQSS